MAAQKPEGIKRTDLQQHDLSVRGREVVQARVDVARKRRSSSTPIRAKRSSMSGKGPLEY